MKFGLTSKALELIVSVFTKHPEIRKAHIYGSRALGTYRDNSDIDIALWGDINELLLAKIASELDELPLPYLFDLITYHEITHDNLKEHIDSCSIEIYSIS